MPGENELWLPELVYPETPGQIDDAYLDRLYQIFERDFVVTKPEWPGLRFALKRMPLRDGYASTFWHLISEGPVESARAINVERCARIGWPRVLINECSKNFSNPNSETIKWWRQSHGSKWRTLIALHDFSYVTVVEERSSYSLLWTAYPTRSHTSLKFSRQFKDYWR